MDTLEHSFADAMDWYDAADSGPDAANATTYQPELSGTELIAELHVLFATQRRAERLICRYLADLADRIAQRRDVALSAYADELHAARCFFRLGVRETRERVRVGRALRTLPLIEQAFIEGELSYSRVREVTRVATAQTERGWLELAQTLDMRAFERRVAGASSVLPFAGGAMEATDLGEADLSKAQPCGADSSRWIAGASNDVEGTSRGRAGELVRTHWLSRETVRVTFELPAEAWAWVERALEGARQANGGRLSDAEALQAVARDALAAQTTGGDASDPRRAVVLYECTNCGRSELETGAGGLELDAAGAAAFSCGAAVYDLASEGRTVTRGGPLPAGVRRAVLLRDRCRCRVPGCARRRYVEVHHLTAQALGGEHSRRNCLVLCTTHHELLHDGKLTVAGDADHELSFCDANGRPMVAATSIAIQLGSLRGVGPGATQLGSLRDVSLDANHLATLRGVRLGASKLGLAVAVDPGNAAHHDSAAGHADGATYAGLLPEPGLLAPGRRLLEVMGRRGSWNMDTLCESSGLAARDVAAALTLLELDGQVRGHDGVFDPV